MMPASSSVNPWHVAAALRDLRRRQQRLEQDIESGTYTGQYRLGKADGLATAIQLIADLTGIGPDTRIPEPRTSDDELAMEPPL